MAAITRETTVREALAQYPGAEPIFDQHGLAGCGGPDGPNEPIGFFAAIHHADADDLLRDLNAYAASVARAQAAPSPAPPSGGPQPYRLFIVTALILTITGGLTSGIAAGITGHWGGLVGEPWLALVQSHGHLQVYGFLAMFIIGMAFHILPRFKGQTPAPPWLWMSTYGLILGGMLLRVTAQPHAQGWLRPWFAASAFVEMAGVLLFAAFVASVLWRARAKREPFDAFIAAGTLGLIGASGMNLALVLEAAGDRSRLLSTAGDQAMLMLSAQGFAAVFVLGVSLRVLPFFAGLRRPHERLLLGALAALVVALPLRAAMTWWPAFDVNGWSADTGHAASLAAAAAFALAVVALRVFEPQATNELPNATPPLFVAMARTAYAWLLIAVALDAYWQLRELDGGFTPYYAAGAVRHAYMAGFATSMFLPMAYRTVPVFSGRALPWPRLIGASFAAVLAGVALRIAPVALTTTPVALDFKLMAAGGVLLLVGLSILGAQVFVSAYMRAPAAAEEAVAAPAAAGAPAMASAAAAPANGPSAPAGPKIHAEMTVAEALRVSPIVLQVLLDFGFGPLADPQMRARMAQTVTIAQAASFLSARPEALVETLNAAVAESAAGSPGDAAEAGVVVRLIETDITESQALDVLRGVVDPEIPVNIIDLGLVYELLVREGYAHVMMTLTAPGCPMADQVEEDVRNALLTLPGIEAADVDIVKEPAWSPERMSRTARAAVGMA